MTSRVLAVLAAAVVSSTAEPLASFDQAVTSSRDEWGVAAMHQTNGASYEFFKDLLPPPRYVNADFRFYPIVLSAPHAKIKARLISNGSGVNLRGGSRGWNDPGTPVTFRVGPDELRFGDILNRLHQPTLADGYLPIAEVRYEHGVEASKYLPKPGTTSPTKKLGIDHMSNVYAVEAFASTDPDFASNGVVFAKFSLASGSNGIITVHAETRPNKFTNGFIVDADGNGLIWLEKSWDMARGTAHARIDTNKFATIAIAAKPFAADALKAFIASGKFNYDSQRQQCADTWNKLLALGMNVEVPEPIVNNAWRNLIIQDISIILDDKMNYSAGNQYQKMYAAESTDAALPMLAWGQEDEMRQVFDGIMNVRDERLPHHFAGHKLSDVVRYYWQTRDLDFIKSKRPLWQKYLDSILNGRTGEHGLLPKENYCTDIEEPCYSFTANATCWAAVRDMVPVLEELGDKEQAAKVSAFATDFKQKILAAVDENLHRETTPPFIPMGLYSTEQIHDPIYNTRIGGYWDLISGYILDSRILVGTEKETWLPDYYQEHGGLFMGLTRSGTPDHTFWTGQHRTNPLYGMRYIVDCLRRDDVERALVSFYGMLAHGMTRNTFIGAEGCSIQPLDEGGRFFYCPPNTSANGQWLSVLRNILVQDWDVDEDGRPDTLRLAFGTPKRWLEDGKTIKVERAPTAFGPVSYKIESHLNKGHVLAQVELPARNKANQILFRARVPEGWHVMHADVAGHELPVDNNGSVNLTSLQGKLVINFDVSRN
ncbi:MAG: hypothetical protein JWO95_3651 [Verrucomicrobiales bacterium]|nr:hypothetical protein [Verrucomicrobiales bacterium]